jgi:hypothetical protein
MQRARALKAMGQIRVRICVCVCTIVCVCVCVYVCIRTGVEGLFLLVFTAACNSCDELLPYDCP